MTSQVKTAEQVAIIRHAYGTNESILIEALAGTGKTFTLLEVLKVLQQPSALVLAFNKRIATEMQRRMPPLPRNRIVHTRTLHAAGNWIVQHHFPKAQYSSEITEERIRNAAGAGTLLRVLGASTKLLRIVKDFQHDRDLNLDVAWQLGADFDCYSKLAGNHEIQQVVEIVERAYKASLVVGNAIDYSDQGWLPLVLGLDPPSRYRAILLDEAQDVNPNQFAMVERLLAPGGRIIAAGDLNQQIYSWRGAIGDAIWRQLVERYKAKRFPLTCTWRCDRAIVAEANQLVPGLRARPNAGAGVVSATTETQFHADLMQASADGERDDSTVFVLSRNNAELLRVALELWREKVPFNLAQSNDLLGPLKGVLAKLLRGDKLPAVPTFRTNTDDAIDQALSLFHFKRQRGEAQAEITRKMVMGSAAPVTSTVERFRQQLGAWYMTEMMKASNAGSTAWAERIDDQHRTILYCLNYVRDPREIEPLLEQIYLVDEMCWITLSTVHKAKGLEANHVYLLRETFQRHQNRRDRDGVPIAIPDEELHIEYVGMTRARKTLTWVTLTKDEA